MPPLRQRMLEELQRRNYSRYTISSYISSVKEFAEYFHKSPALLGSEDVRLYQLYLINEKKLAPQTVKVRMAALRFFYWKTLKRRDLFFDDMPIPKTPVKLPVVLSREEVSQMIDGASSLKRRTMLMVLYATGIRRAELTALKLTDIDSKLMVLHIRAGKDQRDRDLPMTPRLLAALRDYWRWTKPRCYLFPSHSSTAKEEKPISSKTVWNACYDAALAAGLTKTIGPHTLRHSFATHHVEAGTDHRILSVDEDHVTFRWKDYAHDSQQRTMSLPCEEFLQRFLQHVLPKGLPRIRYYGWLATRRRGQLLPLCRELLHQETPLTLSEDPYVEHCPHCGGEMGVVERFTPGLLMMCHTGSNMRLTVLDHHRFEAAFWCTSLVSLEVCLAGHIPVDSHCNPAVSDLQYVSISANNSTFDISARLLRTCRND